MKVMIVTGGTDSIWTKEFIEKILVPLGCEIYIQKNPMDTGCFVPRYEELGVNFVFPYSVNKKLMRIPKIRKWYGYSKRFRVLDNSLDLDYIVCIFGNPFYLKCAHKLASPKTKIITWFIGSDLLRAGKGTLKRLAAWMEKTDSRSVCLVEKLNEEYKKKLNKQGADALIDFGMSQIEEIEKVAATEKNHKETFLGIGNDYRTIAIGYNGSSAMQHEKVLDAIAAIPDIRQKKICIVLPMTYQKNKAYTEKLRNKLKDMGLRFVILEDFLDSKGMARLWLSVDIFVNAQISDSFSASMLESLYADCTVINGIWLKYKELDDWGVPYSSFADFQELTNILESKINNYKRIPCKNKEFIQEKASWNSCRNAWAALFAEEN